MTDREPGSIKPTELGLNSPVVIPRDERGRIRWALFKNEPKYRIQIIEEEVQSYVSSGGILSKRRLEKAGRSDISVAIQRYYPGRMKGLKTRCKERAMSDASFGAERQPSSHYDSPEEIAKTRTLAESFVKANGSISANQLAKSGDGHLVYRISAHFSGGWVQLRKELNLDGPKPEGFWTDERIKTEIETNFPDRTVMITPVLLKEKGLSKLFTAINKSCGIIQLNADRGNNYRRRAPGYWNDIANIEEEARSFFHVYGRLSQGLIRKHRRIDLEGGIRKYPGGMNSLKEKIGLGISYKPQGFWTMERIQTEALVFYQQNGKISHNILLKAKRGNLSSAINKHYPGGWAQLRKDIGIKIAQNEILISPEEADQRLMEFFEEVK